MGTENEKAKKTERCTEANYQTRLALLAKAMQLKPFELNVSVLTINL